MHTALIFFTLTVGCLFTASRSGYAFYAFLFLLWLIASLRIGEGPDYFAYQYAYNALSNNVLVELTRGDLADHEIGFRLLGSTLKWAGFNYPAYNSALALFCLLPIGLLARRLSPYPVLSLLVFFGAFFFTWPYSGVRQGLALSVGAYFLLELAPKGKDLTFLAVAIICSTIHLSAVSLLVFYFAFKLRLRPRYQFSIILVFVFIGLIFQNFLFKYLDQIPFGSRLLFYSESFFTTTYLDFKTLARAAIFGFSLYVYAIAKKTHDEVLAGICSILMVSFVVYISLKFSEIAAAQVSLYGFVFIIFLFPRYLAIRGSDFNKIIKWLVVLVFVNSYFFKTFFDMKNMSYENKANINLMSEN